MSKDHEYLYPYSAQEAKKRNQLSMWRESYHVNVACRNAIEETIRQNFDGMHLKKDCLEPVLAEYGYKRTEWVLATTLQELSWDGRFSRANKQWAARRYIPQDERHNAEITVRSHPAILDGFVLLGGELGTAYPSAGERTEEPVKPFALPPANKEMRRVFAYLIKHRGIARDVVAHFAKAGLLYEDAEYHNAVFVGTDTDGVPHHAHKRSANSYGKAFRLNVEGSDPRYSFHYFGTDRSLYVFEAPIDMLSFITLYPENWQRHSYVACCGTSIQPVLQMLEQVPQLDTVLLCLDNDEAGHQASRRMREQLDARYSVERLIPENKDWNDDLTLSGGNAQGFSMNEMR